MFFIFYKNILSFLSVVTGVMCSRYERYIFHMCAMKIVAKLISFEQIQPSKKPLLETIFYNTKIKKNEIWKQVRFYNRYRVFCEIASLNNYVIIHYL